MVIGCEPEGSEVSIGKSGAAFHENLRIIPYSINPLVRLFLCEEWQRQKYEYEQGEFQFDSEEL